MHCEIARLDENAEILHHIHEVSYRSVSHATLVAMVALHGVSVFSLPLSSRSKMNPKMRCVALGPGHFFLSFPYWVERWVYSVSVLTLEESGEIGVREGGEKVLFSPIRTLGIVVCD